eukprot:GFUD01080212.1.p1 GENE.GFUD01080212.1~~GFUD01080212.1.p1  ORF type:complete len:689 (-),score=143.19 GFUD01080212.1:1876-3942(-)
MSAQVGQAESDQPVKALDEMEDRNSSADDRLDQDEKSRQKRKGHSKNSSISERDRKIGHRRINEEGQVSYKKIETNQLMGSIQLGIHDSVGGLAKYPERDLLMHDFMTVETTQFPKHGGHQSPAHTYSDFTFRTYAPVAFRYFRDLFGIPPDDFMISICNETLRELSNPGASGSVFYLTKDDEFILKTVSLKEADFLQKLLPGYYMNLQQNPRTTLPKFFGMFCYQCNQKNIRLVVMNNLLPSDIKMHLKFDLKGSTYKRKASKHEKEKKSPTFKDLDFMDLLPEGLLLEPETYTALISTMRRDCRVLESFKIMDYSLLVGVHNLDMAAKERAESGGATNMSVPYYDRQKSKRDKLIAHSSAMESIQATSEPVDIPGELPPGGIPARNHKGERILLFVGIIDILQSYRLIKKLEHTFKAMIHDGDTVSVHRPGFYAERFMNFMSSKIFKKIPSSLKHSPSKKNKSVKTKVSSSGPSLAQDKGGQPPNQEDALCGLAKGSPMTTPRAERLPSSNSDDDCHEEQQPTCILPAVLRDRPHTGRGGRGAPPPVPPRSPRRPHDSRDTSLSRGVAGGYTVPPDVVPDGGHGVWSSNSEVASISDIRLEPRHYTPDHMSTNSLGTPSKLSNSQSGRTPTPTWTEGTPSYTESTYSGDAAFPSTPVRSLTASKDSMPDRILEEAEPSSSYHETEM